MKEHVEKEMQYHCVTSGHLILGHRDFSANGHSGKLVNVLSIGRTFEYEKSNILKDDGKVNHTRSVAIIKILH